MLNIKKMVAPLALVAGLMAASPAYAYEVKKGDTMGEIAKSNGMSLNELAAINPKVSNLNLIYVGQTINTNKDNTSKVAAKTVTKDVSGISAADKDLLARLVRAEAESEPYEGKVAVANTILNRVDSSLFPDSIRGVIYQAGQFSPVANGSINKSADADSIRAIEDAINNRNTLGGSLFFYNPAIATSSWLDTKTTVTTIGNHVFKK